MVVKVKVVNQKLKIASNIKTFVADSQNFILFEFDLDDSWRDLQIYAQFTQNDTPYDVALDENYSAYLPSSIIAGQFTLALYGTGTDIIATTNHVTMNVEESILIS